MKMREEGVSGGYSRPRTFSGKKTIKNCKVQGGLDNVVLIDIDSDGFDNVIIIDVPESLEQKLRGSSVLRECKRFPRIISIDDDEIDNVGRPESNEEGDVDLDSDGNSSKRSPASYRMENSVDADTGDCEVIWEKKSAFMLSRCKKTCSKDASFRNCYGLYSESASDSSEASTSDCEVMEGSFGELREQWEKASQKRKSNVRKGQSDLEDQVSRCSSSRDVHSDVEVECRNKQNCEDSICFSSENVNFEKANSSVFAATRDGFVGGGSFNHKMKNPFSNSDLKGEEGSFSWWWKPRSHENTCSKDMEKNTGGEHSFPNSQARPNLQCDHGKASVQGEDASLCEGQHSGETHKVNGRKIDSNDSDEDFTYSSSCCNTESCKARYGTTGSEGKEKIISGEKFVLNALSSDDNMVKGVGSSENKVRPVPKESFVFKNPPLAAPGVSQEKAGHDDTEKTDYRKQSFYETQFHEAVTKPGKLSLAGGKEPLTDLVSNDQHYNERDLLHSPLGDIMPAVQRDIINVREKLKETDEYKLAIEEEWAARQRQLEIQAEEARRLRKKRKAEILRVLDMEKRQRQRVEEMRETQKKDEENLSMKENLRVEIRKELYRLEITCIDMASLLRALGINVEGGFHPLSHEVHAAYKRALLKFHPDRASRTNIRQQVEAEEKFKLISRMKEKFLLAKITS